jgi:ribonuclease-3
LIAAIYLDQGFDEARRFVIEKMLPIMVNESLIHDTNFKSILLETVQGQGKGTPRYEVANEEGPDHDKVFTVNVYIGDDMYGTGTGRNKKEAEQRAAERAVALLQHQKKGRRQHPRQG